MLGINRVTHLDRAGLEVGGGEFAELFARRSQVGGPVIQASSGEDSAGFDLPSAVTLNQYEAFVRRC